MAAITAHDMVFRLNSPVLSGFEADAGRGADLVIIAEPKLAQLPLLAPLGCGWVAADRRNREAVPRDRTLL